jgi:hypothetical protein
MRKILTFAVALSLGATTLTAQNVSVKATNSPASKVFAQIMRQTDINFIYQADILKNVKVSVNAKNQPLSHVLEMMFDGTNIVYKISGKNVTLRAVKTAETSVKSVTISGFVRDDETKEPLAGAAVLAGGMGTTTNVQGFYSLTVPTGVTALTVSYTGYDDVHFPTPAINRNTTLDFTMMTAHQLEELVVVGSRNEAIALDMPEIGSTNLSSAIIKSTPVIFGESDVVKTLQLEPGVSAGVEGFAGMYVHGGNSDENLYMLDNVPLYQVNHFAGLFSAFNTSALRNVDFYKSSFPAKYDGRLSSYMDVHTKDGSLESHHGSFTLGLTSGAFNIDGPIAKGKTSYSLAVRRSWFDLLTLPICAIINATNDQDNTTFQYAFTDVNAKINHHFNDRSRAYVNFYYGDDLINTTYKDGNQNTSQWYEKDKNRLQWGNIVASAGWNYVFSPKIFGEITAAYTRYHTSIKRDWLEEFRESDTSTQSSRDIIETSNNINDWIFRADFDWRPNVKNRINFGVSYTRHSFLPQRVSRTITTNEYDYTTTDSAWTYRANEANAYIGDDWTISSRLRANVGLHASLFNIDKNTHTALSPRASLRYTVNNNVAVKAGYSRTTQYIHQLTETFISLPTDQWLPITGDFKPQTCDKVFAGGYWNINEHYTLSAEVYYKWLDNLIDYKEQYYLFTAQTEWQRKLTSGKGTAKGLDLKVSRDIGKITGQLSYSLMWADRTFAERNGGETYPARFDNRHKINALVMWHINDRWEVNASWTGQSGNMYTLSTQLWDDVQGNHYQIPVNQGLNNYRLPFYHRLDLGVVRNTKHGHWTISLYNAYCNMNVVSLRYGYDNSGRPRFQKFHLLPIIPSFSYTWQF